MGFQFLAGIPDKSMKNIWYLINLLLCLIGRHKWDECKCSVCKKIRNEGHDWIGGKCGHCQTPWSKEDAIRARQRGLGQISYDRGGTYFHDIDDGSPG